MSSVLKRLFGGKNCPRMVKAFMVGRTAADMESSQPLKTRNYLVIRLLHSISERSMCKVRPGLCARSSRANILVSIMLMEPVFILSY